MTAIIPYAELVRTSDDFAKYPPWCSIAIECLSAGTDWDTAGGLLAKLEGYTVSLRLKHRVPRLDVSIIDPAHIHEGEGEHYIDGHAGGMLVQAVTDKGDKVGGPVFVCYEDIEAIGVY